MIDDHHNDTPSYFAAISGRTNPRKGRKGPICNAAYTESLRMIVAATLRRNENNAAKSPFMRLVKRIELCVKAIGDCHRSWLSPSTSHTWFTFTRDQFVWIFRDFKANSSRYGPFRIVDRKDGASSILSNDIRRISTQ